VEVRSAETIASSSNRLLGHTRDVVGLP
jgi:hypothetical protein